MRDERLGIVLAFCLALLPTIIVPAFAPQVRLFFFAPFFVLILYRRPLRYCLWMAAGMGILLDLLATQHRMGIQATCLCVTTALLFRMQRHFFLDKLTTLPIMTYLFSLVYTVIFFFLLQIFDRGPAPSWGWVLTDLIVWPICDAVYAFIVFAYPAILLRRNARRDRI